MSQGKMLGRSGEKRVLAGPPSNRRHCSCEECDLGAPDHKTQRVREQREWRAEQW